MTSQAKESTGSRWRRALIGLVVSASLAVGLTLGFGSATAHADGLDELEQEFTTARGAGQVANLLNTALELRAMGFKPTQAEYAEIQDALRYRPNQTPLIDALKVTVARQLRTQQHMQQVSDPQVTGINQLPPGQESNSRAPFDGGISFGGG
jgi:hypothetical protein